MLGFSMVRLVTIWAIRIIVSFALVFGIGYWFIKRPAKPTSDYITTYSNQVVSAYRSLETAKARLREIPGPDTKLIERKSLAKAYVERCATAVGAFGSDIPGPPRSVRIFSMDPAIQEYNSTIRNPNFEKDLADMGAALLQADRLATHHYGVIKALANLLGYIPAQDTKSNNEEVLRSNMAATASGLNITIKRLTEAPRYEYEDSEPLITVIQQLESVRKSYESFIGNSAKYEAKRQQFITKTREVQHFVIQNRQRFWREQSAASVDRLEKAYATFQQYMGAFSNF